MAGQSTAILDLLFDHCDGVLAKEEIPDIQTLDFVSSHADDKVILNVSGNTSVSHGI